MPEPSPPRGAHRTLTARWVFPVHGPPLERGTVTIQGDRITAVAPAGRRTADEDLGNVALLPGLVNAHTHLDLSGLRGQCPPTPDFTRWLRQVIEHRRGTSLDQVRADIRAGLQEALSYGTTLLGDISGAGWSLSELAGAPLRAVIFYEVLGLPRARAEEAWQRTRGWLATQRDIESDHLRLGISPHAPYSASKWLLERVAEQGQQHPIAVHLAETSAEIALLETHAGPFVEFLRELGVWAPDELAISPADVLAGVAKAANLLIVHGNYLAPAALPAGATVVYCPRTHAAFGHPPHPLRALLKCGVRVALGTDSLASNPDLDILAEARFVQRRFPDVAGDVLLRMATLSGAEALGWSDVTGSLTPGKSADLVVLPLPDRDEPDPHRLVLDSPHAIARVLFRGEWLPEPAFRARATARKRET